VSLPAGASGDPLADPAVLHRLVVAEEPGERVKHGARAGDLRLGGKCPRGDVSATVPCSQRLRNATSIKDG
jgi:hypothetical protein